MPLNYKKWDALELSDDSDIEGHPNVDHKSLVRWRQRDIHEKRQARNHRIAELEVEIPANTILLDRLKGFSDALQGASDAPSFFSHTVERLQTQPSPEGPKTNAADKVTYDGMLLAVLNKASEDAKAKKEESKSDPDLGELLIDEIKMHVMKLGEAIENWQKELEELQKEKTKKITTEDMHDGWDSKYVPPKPAPPPVPGADKKTKKVTTTEFEVLNPGTSSSEPSTSAAPSTSSPATTPSSVDDYDELPEMTPSLEEFSRIPMGAYDKSFEYIQTHREVVVPGASDALLIAAFNAQHSDNPKYAKQCVNQSLLLQYCDKLGPDGVRLFFRKMMSNDKRAEVVFVKDVEDTYAHLVERVRISKEEEASQNGVEQIQLVAENPDTQITFNVPDGPPPDNLVLEGPGTEDMDVEDVRRALQMRWDVFQAFDDNMKKALRSGKLEAVNKILAGMKVEDAEQVVQALDMAGILNFAEGGIRDETNNDAGVGDAEGVE
ncbi:hsp90-like protein [Punctularia strigosozonata HHB-11173 SS5]|uniref:hsp90-like protein n=1 Tax=Punctularia strigosozonata (strain HHB-11173) TaxID=741275 RepID=UPI0004417D23|nr:hsp90-like protein [Punctularia strigosozonata HHB-11173 SS5]EIN12685.1 hsp90-like protein [Punctularia strigosozonata HHB-11173 SS5]